MMSSVIKHALLLGTGLLPAVFLRMFICCTAAVFMLAFVNWPLSLAVGRTKTKIRRLIESSSLSRTTYCFFGRVGIASEDRGAVVATSVRYNPF